MVLQQILKVEGVSLPANLSPCRLTYNNLAAAGQHILLLLP